MWINIWGNFTTFYVIKYSLVGENAKPNSENKTNSGVIVVKRGFWIKTLKNLKCGKIKILKKIGDKK